MKTLVHRQADAIVGRLIVPDHTLRVPAPPSTRVRLRVPQRLATPRGVALGVALGALLWAALGAGVGVAVWLWVGRG